MTEINYGTLQRIVATSSNFRGEVMEYSVSRGTVTFIDRDTLQIVNARIDSVTIEIEAQEVAE